MSVIPTNWVDNIGMFVDAAYLNNLGVEVNANTYARTLSGTYASRPTAAASNTGAHYFCTDTDAVYKSDGTAWTKIRSGGLCTPDLADPGTGWTAVGLSSSTFTADKDTILMNHVNSGADRWEMNFKALPGGNYGAVFQIDHSFNAVGGRFRGGIMLRNSSDGKLATFNMFYNNSTAGTFEAGLWNSPTTQSSNASTLAVTKIPNFMRIDDDGTNRYFQYSYNGVDWIYFYGVARTNFVTPDQIGWGADTLNSTAHMRLRSFKFV